MLVDLFEQNVEIQIFWGKKQDNRNNGKCHSCLVQHTTSNGSVLLETHSLFVTQLAGYWICLKSHLRLKGCTACELYCTALLHCYLSDRLGIDVLGIHLPCKQQRVLLYFWLCLKRTHISWLLRGRKTAAGQHLP